MVLSAALSAPTTAGTALAVAGLPLLVVRHPFALVAALAALGVAVAVAIDHGAASSGAPLWGAGLLVAAHLAERALDLPDAGALVLLAAHASTGATAAGLVAAALLAVLPARLARGSSSRER